MSIVIRSISEQDNIALAGVIRSSLEEFNVPKTGTVYSDPMTDRLYELFKTEGASYFVVEEDGELLGGCGIFPTEGLPDDCAELVKFYLSGAARGKGLGKQLLETCFQAAIQTGYSQLYLESFPQLEKAVSMYLKAGFEHIPQAMGNSGHHACTIWMLKNLYH